MSKKVPLYDFTEYAYSKQIVTDYPRILAMYYKLIPALIPHSAYAGVFLVLQALQESANHMEKQLKHYERVYTKKGKIQAE